MDAPIAPKSPDDPAALPSGEESLNVVREWRERRRIQLDLYAPRNRSVFHIVEGNMVKVDPVYIELLALMADNGVSLSALVDEAERVMAVARAENAKAGSTTRELIDELRSAERSARAAATVLHEQTRLATEDGLKRIAGTIGRITAKHGEAVEQVLTQFAAFNAAALAEQKLRLQLSKEVYENEERQVAAMHQKLQATLDELDDMLRRAALAKLDGAPRSEKRQGSRGFAWFLAGALVGALACYAAIVLR